MKATFAIGLLVVAALLLLQGVGRNGSALLANEGYQGAMLELAEASDFKQRHQSVGVSCAGCHGSEPDYTEAPPASVCLECHESNEAVAARTKDVVPNPHHSHMGQQVCTECHSEHHEPRLSCNQCHVFEMEMP